MKRTHTCGELEAGDEAKDVALCGWVQSRRDHGGVIFVDLRDKYGITQVVFNPGTLFFPSAEKLRREDCIRVLGKVHKRKDGMENPNLKTGKIELFSSDLEILNASEVPPFEIENDVTINDELRLKYRYLDLRRPVMQNNLLLRHKAAQAARKYLSEQGFIEVETPLLVKSTPEGARDYVVPSRVNPGLFYALPQSPQLYKEILMVAGVDKYFQLARCLRDEDLRADRQPEHTQIDIEMSFVEPQDVHEVVEGLMKSMFKECKGMDLKTPFPKIAHKDAMEKYGCDKPDIRYELFLHDVSDIVKNSDFGVFKDIVAKGGIVKCIVCPADITRNEIDKYIKFCQDFGAKGMAWMRMTDKGLESNIVKFFSEDIQKKLLDKTGAKPGNIIMFIADSIKITNQVLDKLRQDLARKLNLFNPKDFKFCWIVDFPLFEWNEDEEKWDAAHNPFCMPKEEDMKYLETDPGKMYCKQYDLVLNGWELASGSVRINKPELQAKVMKVIGLTKDDLEKKFGFLLEAFKYGAPPHGGIGVGFDRTVALMLELSDIREVIAFPKNKSAECPMDDCPSSIDDKQMKELSLKCEVVKKGQ